MTLSNNSAGADAPSEASSDGPAKPGMLSPLRHKAFAELWGANIASNMGGIIQGVGAAWLMTTLNPSPQMVALVQFANVAPIMLLSLVAGALADLYDRRLIMLSSQIFMAVISVALTVFAFLGHMSPWALLLFTFLIAAGQAIQLPAWQSSISDQVPRNELAGAVSLNAFGFNVGRSVAPAIGGAIVAALGAATAFAINAVSYIGLILALHRWRPEFPKAQLPKETLHRAIGSGMRYVSLSPAIIGVTLRALAFGILGAALWALMPLIARNVLQGGAMTYGAIFGAFGLGAMTSALLITRLRERHSSDVLVNASTAAYGIGTIVAGVSPFLPLTVLATTLAGAAWVLALASLNVAVQMSSPRWVAGRAIAIYQMALFGGLAIGSALWGAIATHAGLSEALVAAGALMVVSLLWLMRFKMPSMEGASLDPWSRKRVLPEPLLAVGPRSGPVMVSIDYNVATEDAPAFVEAMHEMGRIRRRDGAQRWSLAQDIDNPDIWTEHYHSPTWLDHLRRIQRPTVADEAAHAKVLSFHRGDPPVIRRLLEQQTDEPPRTAPAARPAGPDIIQDPTPNA